MCAPGFGHDVHPLFVISCPHLPIFAEAQPKLAPIAWPIAKLLDWVLGADEGHTYKKAELKSFLQFHRQGEEPLRDDEISILNGVLELNTKRAGTIMTPMQVNYLMSAPSRLFANSTSASGCRHR
jgi:metal transporter CNNM